MIKIVTVCLIMVKNCGHPLVATPSNKRFYSRVVRKYVAHTQPVGTKNYLYKGLIGELVYNCHSSTPKLFKILEYITHQMPIGPVPKFRMVEMEWTRDSSGQLHPTDKVILDENKNPVIWTIGTTEPFYALWKECSE